MHVQLFYVLYRWVVIRSAKIFDYVLFCVIACVVFSKKVFNISTMWKKYKLLWNQFLNVGVLSALSK